MRNATATAGTLAPSTHARWHVRRAQPSDLDALVALELCSFNGDRMSRAQYRRHLDSNSALVLVAIGEQQLLGSAVLFLRKHSQLARLYSLATRPEARGLGIGAHLIEAAELAVRTRHCHAMQLEVRADNQQAIALYVRMGYQRTLRLAGYYEDGADGWQYRKRLD